MDLRQLRQFATLAETLNFRRAAERLNMAQPPLSVSIKKLEREIGVQLFDRTGRSVRLTEAGRGALEAARRTLVEAEQVVRAARLGASGGKGRVRLAFAGSATYSLLPTLLPLYRSRYPRVELELREGTNTEIVALLDQNAIDIGLVRAPLVCPDHIRTLTVEHDTFVAALPLDNPLTRRRKLTLRELKAQPFIGYAASGSVSGLQAATRRVFMQAGFKPHIAQEALQVHTVISLVASGMGVAIVPSVCARYSSDQVVFRHLERLPSAAEIGIALAYQEDRETPAGRAFRETAFGLVVGQGRRGKGPERTL